jgi:predicted nucleotidyltransferase
LEHPFLKEDATMLDVQTLLRNTPWLPGFLRDLTHRFPSIRQVYLFGSRIKGEARADSDWDILVYGGYDNAMSLMCGLARAQGEEWELTTAGQLVDLYVETEGPTLIAVWGGELPRVLPSEVRNWREGHDFVMLIGDPTTPQLGARTRWRKENG